MPTNTCPTCGREAGPDAAGLGCEHASGNGAAKPKRATPPPPPEVANWKIERPTPEMLEEARRTFDEAEYLAGVREIEAGRGHRFEDFIDEIERIANGRE